MPNTTELNGARPMARTMQLKNSHWTLYGLRKNTSWPTKARIAPARDILRLPNHLSSIGLQKVPATRTSVSTRYRVEYSQVSLSKI